MGSINKSRFSGMESIRFTILDPNNKNGIWEDVSLTQVRLKPKTHLTKEAVQEITKDDFDKIWAILLEARKNTSLKKIILIVIAWCVGFLFLADLGWVINFNAQFTVYQDDQYKFSIKYPKSWKVIVHPKDTVAVVFLRPKDFALDTLQENLNVTVQPLPKGIFTLAEFSERIKAQMISVFGSSVRFVQYNPLDLGWHKGYMLSIEAPQPDNLKMVNAWVLYRGQAYILTFLGNINKYPQDLPILKSMVSSFKLQS